MKWITGAFRGRTASSRTAKCLLQQFYTPIFIKNRLVYSEKETLQGNVSFLLSIHLKVFLNLGGAPVELEITSSDPFVRTLCNPFRTVFAHIRMDRTVFQSFCFERIFVQLIESITKDTFDFHLIFPLLDPDGGNFFIRGIIIGSVVEENMYRTVLFKRLSFMAEF